MSSLAQQDLVRRRRLLEALRNVDGVACREALAAAQCVSRHDLARVHARPHRDRDSPVALELLVQPGKALAHLGSGPDRANGVVLVQDGDSEHGHHRVADELLDRALVRLDDRLHLVEVAAHHPPQRFRVEPFAQSRRAGDVREDDRDGLAHLAGGRRFFGQDRAARPAELESLRGSPGRTAGSSACAESKFRAAMSERHLTDSRVMS